MFFLSFPIPRLLNLGNTCFMNAALQCLTPAAQRVDCWAVEFSLCSFRWAETEAHTRHAEVLPTLRAHFLVPAPCSNKRSIAAVLVSSGPKGLELKAAARSCSWPSRIGSSRTGAAKLQKSTRAVQLNEKMHLISQHLR